MNIEPSLIEKNANLKNGILIFSTLIATTNFFIVFGIIYSSASYFPFQDSWVIAHFYIKFKTSGLSVLDFLLAHNEHRQPIPLLFVYLNFLTTNWSPFANLVTNIALLSLSYLLIANLYISKHYNDSSGCFCFIYIFAISIFMFNFGQWLNYVWEWQITWFVFLFFTSCFVFFLQKYCDCRNNIYFLFLIISALLSSGSTAAGFMLWPAGFICLILIETRKAHTLIWSLISIFLISIYVLNKPPTEIRPDNFPLIESTLEYTVRLIGSPAGDAFWYGLLLACCGSCALVTLIVRRQHESMIGWIAIFLAVGAAALFAGLTRGPWLGPAEGSSSRYATLASLFVVSSYILTLKVVRKGAAQFALTLLYVVPIAIHLGTAMKDVAWLNQRIEAGRKCLVERASDNACIDILYAEGHSEEVRRWWDQLQVVGWQVPEH